MYIKYIIVFMYYKLLSLKIIFTVKVNTVNEHTLSYIFKNACNNFFRINSQR